MGARNFQIKNGLVVDGDITAVNLDISGNVDVDGTLEADAITLNGTSLATSATTDTTNASNIGSGTLATGRLAAALTAQTSMLNTSLVVGRDADNQIKFSTDNQMIFRVGAGDGVTFKASGEIEATSLDISGDVDVDGTLEADAITVNGSALASSATTDTTNASNISSGTLASGRLPDLAVSDFAASAIVLESEGIGSNDNDTTLPTSAAVKDYVDSNAGGSPGGSDTFVQYNNGGSFGATTLSYDDTAGSEQFLFDDTSDQPLVKIVQRGTGHAFEVHDQASDSSIFTISEVGQVTIKTATPQAGGLTINDDMYVGQIKSSAFGSASSPRYTFHSDSNTGMYSGGADVLKFSTGGTERVKLSSSGLQLGAANAEVTTILDEDDMSTDSDTALATQQSIKAYVDNNAGGGVSLANDGNNRVVTATGSGGINGEANLTFDGTTLAVTASGTSTTLLLESTDAGAADAPILELYRNSSSPANTDDLGQILWSGEKSDGSKYSITKMYSQINTVDNSDRLMINIASSGGSGLNDYEYMRFDGGVRDVIINEGGQDIDFRIEGDSDTALFFTDASSDRIGIGTTSPTTKLDVSGSITVGGDLNVGSGDLFVDDSTGRVGIGIGTSPINLLHIKGDNSTTSQSSGGAASITIEQDGTGDAALNFLLTSVQRWIMGIDNSDSDKFKIETGSTSLSTGAALTIDTAGNVGIGTTSPQANLHISSGTSGDAVLILEADTDNSDETDQPYIVFEQDGGTQNSAVGLTSGANTDNNALLLSNSVGSSGVQAGIVFKTGTTDGYTNATESMRIYPAGETQARKTKVKTVSSNTTLGDDDSGKTIYWTGGTLTLPATAESGQQFVVINNKGSSATPGLGTSNSIQTGWTAHAAMADETARTYISVAANKWIYIG